MTKRHLRIILISLLVLLIPTVVWYATLYTPQTVAEAFLTGFVTGDISVMRRMSAGSLRTILTTADGTQASETAYHIINTRSDVVGETDYGLLIRGRATKRETMGDTSQVYEQEVEMTVGRVGLLWRVLDAREVAVRSL